MTIAPRVASLAAAARTFDGPRELGFISDRLVSGPAGQPMFDPYVALVGPSYLPGASTLVLATAQNLAQFIGRWDAPKAAAAVGHPGDPLWRLYGGAPPGEHRPFSRVPIQPWADGVLVGLAGVLALARGEVPPASLDEISRGTAVTNSFKHSLHRGGRLDLNPVTGPRAGLDGWNHAIAAKYLEVTRTRLVGPELQILRPRDIITFRHLPVPAVDGATVHAVNDPAWIKRGRGGATAPGSTWQASAAGVPVDVADRIDGWVTQMGSPYSADKAEATRLYLAKYYSEFKRALAGRV
jgi:hypothetical protein